jgi:nodulation protein E
MNRVVVTGRGVISAIGRGMKEFSQALGAGRLGISALPEMPARVGAVVRDYDERAEFDASQRNLLDRSTQFALLSAREALAESGLEGELGPRTAAIIGTGVGCLSSLEQSYEIFHADRERRLHPFTVPKVMPNAAAGHISLAHGITGPAFMVATACASSAYAVSLGMQMIRTGVVDVAVVGGTESCLVDGNLKAWEALRVLAPDTCRPFSRDRRGLVLGEGAAVVVLESLEHARRRGAPIRGEIAGSSLNSDAHHILIPSLDGQTAAIRGCLADSGLCLDDIGYVNAHGTATAANDVTETRALHKVFGTDAYRLAVSSTKAMHGHALGAGGAIELVATLVGLEQRFAPPTMNFTEPDPECDLNYVTNEAQELRCGAALTNSFAFGGHNAVLAVRSAAWV